jgi:hypothetical protein
MPTQEIARDDWASFFDSFSLRHQGWLVTVKVVSPDTGAQVELRELPLQGITADAKNSGEDHISIIVGQTAGEYLTHTINAPTQVMLKQTEEGTDEAIEIISADGTTLVRLRSAMPPEMVDGIM